MAEPRIHIAGMPADLAEQILEAWDKAGGTPEGLDGDDLWRHRAEADERLVSLYGQIIRNADQLLVRILLDAQEDLRRSAEHARAQITAPAPEPSKAPASGQRAAEPGERCTCGRQAVLVFIHDDGGEVGYCGLPDGGDKSGPCSFCGGERHEIGPCPEYRLRPAEVEAAPR